MDCFLRRIASVKVTRAQAIINRKKIVEAASVLFRKHGFDGIGIADIMKAVGLTVGGFYFTFDSKDHLAAEACAHAWSHDGWKRGIDAPSGGRLDAIVRGYLSRRHRSDRAHGCLMAALGSDIVLQPRIVRRAFTEGLRSRIDALCRLMPGRSAPVQREQALATLAGLVGALILSRGVNDPKLADEILGATMTALGCYHGSGSPMSEADRKAI
jgi:TetR/AcrR family transcriptional repressor of nem operon